MKAGEIYEPGKIRLIDVPDLALDAHREPGWVLFEPQLGCLCGSDIPYFACEPRFMPEVGHSLHEIIGRVVASTSDQFPPGTRILHMPKFLHGLIERIWIKEDQAIPLDPELDDEQAVLSQPLGTVIAALKQLPNLLGQTVVIVGQGPIGQLFSAACSSMGARKVIAIDRLAYRLETSSRMGATDVIDGSKQDPVNAVHQLTGGAMADLVVEAAGHHEFALNLCVELVRKRGRIIQFGIPPEHDAGLLLEQLFRKVVTLHTSVLDQPHRDYSMAMRWIRDGCIDVKPLVTHRFPMAEVQTAFEHYRDRKDGAIKVFIEYPAF
jgi:threonine dehydrogenase-like Zn-dependent dehydrogenase